MANENIDLNYEIEGVPVKDLVVRQLLTKAWINRIRLKVGLPIIELEDMAMSNKNHIYPNGDAVEVNLGIAIYCVDPDIGDYQIEEIEQLSRHPLGDKIIGKIYAIVEETEIPEYVIRFSYNCSGGLYPWLKAPDTRNEDTLAEIETYKALDYVDFIARYQPPHVNLRADARNMIHNAGLRMNYRPFGWTYELALDPIQENE